MCKCGTMLDGTIHLLSRVEIVRISTASCSTCVRTRVTLISVAHIWSVFDNGVRFNNKMAREGVTRC